VGTHISVMGLAIVMALSGINGIYRIVADQSVHIDKILLFSYLSAVKNFNLYTDYNTLLYSRANSGF
jgi:hypothetical protein